MRGLSVGALIAGAVVLGAATAGAQSGPDGTRDRWFGADKVKHFALSFLVQSVGYSTARATGMGHGSSLGMASALTAVVGFGKEWHDRRTTGFSARDLAWNAAGAGAATMLLRRTAR
jgi:uncharacterized protein YfiM (DUF2279 family)